MQIKTPQNVIDAQLDQIQKEHEKHFQHAFLQVNRAKARLFWQAGYQQALKDYGLTSAKHPEHVAQIVNPQPPKS